MKRQMFYSLALILAAHIIACAQESAPAPLAQCPALSVDCPTDISDGKSAPSTFSARLTGANPEAKLIFNWTVSSGVIETGQGTQTIKVIGAGDSLTATLEVQGLPQGCPNMFSCSMFSCPAPLARRFDSYGNLDFRDEKARLSNFALELSNSHSVQGYLIAYGIKADRQGKTQARLERAKAYLVQQHGLDEGLIVLVDGGLREERAMELWVVPTGSSPPTASPTVASN